MVETQLGGDRLDGPTGAAADVQVADGALHISCGGGGELKVRLNSLRNLSCCNDTQTVSVNCWCSLVRNRRNEKQCIAPKNPQLQCIVPKG